MPKSKPTASARPDPMRALDADPAARAQLAERAAELARRADAAAPRALAPYIHFRLGRYEEYGAPGEWVDEVVTVASIARVPGAPAAIAGVVNRRGQMLPVVDLRRYLGVVDEAVDAVAPATQDLVVVSTGAATLGLRVDTLIGMAEYDAETLVPVPSAASGRHALGLLQGRVTLLDIEKILADICAT
ncbi:MAG: chemotaxis protein CheW [Pelomonas sp.]|nr:chemotaxis protein CheW [Roseateles sp.]